MTRYPRDMTGYGATPPEAHWPDGAKIAVQIVVNYEEGGENNILHGDPASEAFLSEIVGAAAWPGQRHWNMETIYEYGARAGFWRLHRLLADVPVTVFAVATALARAPEQVAAMKDAGWDIASHGLKWIEFKDMPEEEERAQIAEAIRLHTEVVGTRPRGFYQGRASMNSVRLGAELGFDWLADSYADDLPYWERIDGRDHLIVPYTLDCNDMRFATPQGFNSGEQFYEYMRATFAELYREGEEGRPRMMSIGLHCRLAGRPGRIEALRRFLDFAQGHEGVWFATRSQIADHWAATHPPMAKPRPSEMTKAEFVSEFGGIFEHSPWIAEAAHGLELGPTHDTARGVHSALARVFRTAPDDKRLDVLRAHPDLAGKLAQARRLTPESANEQSSAGLDALTDAERAAFEDANARYTAKFGFPFIIAVRDNTKDSILAAFERRIGNDRETEIAEACRQVERIAELRLIDKLGA
ncbi:allantoinase PuuE [Ponticoccus sp. SC2-23]|uniref:allantoinase PuuE n=1 Tax=Alexandriicola marinus TaxID=2081710 RepID=UPI000FD74569|nr:allantoinase PuuE [Alexandriicola marinus]MBM1220797.1 allantoinase PuuE [Ponticoccus sp. SC6-9]MBM1225367.1 allantoinase PuuE [Ponticoccus sp. SC6-15]MBM1227550.1 allantoinase PuuE [Ponticoccus sp. SC6-38]MBM1234812.1 allantoinase PuuE [Ponticoccus sp. SC6-45]MBM1238052.1 allantoinase PuuE [Ponticoccus sp. SC6-49]MBM1244315.1 allantoinase PuuE [Ponticoccus sp. SC2-64]MBM1248336.1 allantoinase PuuE [Ponticoccus sp. SC6-42]MBM1252452.1 allantoinase PuuE [Ponticoccus sp. SC6-33]MBM1256061